MRLIRIALPIAALIALMSVAAPSFAKHGGDAKRVTDTGSCTGSSTSKLKAKPDNGKLAVEFEVDQNKNGVKWNYRFRRNGKSVASGARRTKAPSGSFSVERRIGNPAGKDKISAVAKRANGETCRASVTL